jgi:hypothetical protein
MQYQVYTFPVEILGWNTMNSPQVFEKWGAALSFMRLVLIGTTHAPAVHIFSPSSRIFCEL